MIKKAQDKKMRVIHILVVDWLCVQTRLDYVRYNVISDKVEVT